MTMSINRISILAVGLIGGSLALALRSKGFAGEIVGWGRTENSLEKALELGVIDRFSLDLEEATSGADVIVVATPTLIAEKVIQQLAVLVKQGLLSEKVIITDVASVKGNLLSAARKAFGKVPANLVLAHPIAGSEQSGVEAAFAELFVDHRVIITPVEETSPEAIDAVKSLWQSTGAEVVEMPVADHDKVLAATSHLPHMLAFALVDALASSSSKQDIFKFAAGGFRDFTRIASSDPAMWRDIALANSDAVVEAIDSFSEHLGLLRAAVVEADSDTLSTVFSRAKASRDEYIDVRYKNHSED